MKTVLTVLLLAVASATSWGITITGTSTSRTVSGTPTSLNLTKESQKHATT